MTQRLDLINKHKDINEIYLHQLCDCIGVATVFSMSKQELLDAAGFLMRKSKNDTL